MGCYKARWPPAGYIYTLGWITQNIIYFLLPGFFADRPKTVVAQAT